MKKALFIPALVVTLAACGGGGGSSNKTIEPPRADPAGIWRGTLTDLLEQDQFRLNNPGATDEQIEAAGRRDALVIADKDGYLRLFASVSNGPFGARGKTTRLETDSFVGYLDVYSLDPGSLNPDASSLNIRLFDLSGDLSTASRWTGEMKFGSVARYSFELSYDAAESGKTASVERLAGIGTFTQNAVEIDNAERLHLTFTTDGRIEGGNARCSFDGSYWVPDSGQNIYRVNLTVTAIGYCNDLRGSYGGMGSLVSEQGLDVLKLSIGKSDRILTYSLTP